MYEQQALIRTFIIFLMFGIIVGCSDGRKNAQEQKPVVQQEVIQPVNAMDKEELRKKIVEIGIPMYKGMAFVEVKRKSKGSPLLAAVYEVPAKGEKDYDKVRSYYAAGLKKALVPKGWVEGKATDTIILYRKGFEIFFADFSRIIIPPDIMKIRVVFNYGG